MNWARILPFLLLLTACGKAPQTAERSPVQGLPPVSEKAIRTETCTNTVPIYFNAQLDGEHGASLTPPTELTFTWKKTTFEDDSSTTECSAESAFPGTVECGSLELPPLIYSYTYSTYWIRGDGFQSHGTVNTNGGLNFAPDQCLTSELL